MASNVPNFDSLRSTFIPPSNTTSAITQPKIQNKKDANIMEQMVSYDKDITNTLIDQLNEEYLEQTKINQILKEKDYDDSVKEIEEFIEKNEKEIEEQVLNLENIYNSLKYIVKENKELQEDKSTYKDLLQDDKTKDVAQNMKKLKSLKSNILLFLQQNGIHMRV
tara:strand:- start:2065 stop:2559 length:495 start_codon:yes stop_codon:yes gene_type:complete